MLDLFSHLLPTPDTDEFRVIHKWIGAQLSQDDLDLRTLRFKLFTFSRLQL